MADLTGVTELQKISPAEGPQAPTTEHPAPTTVPLPPAEVKPIIDLASNTEVAQRPVAPEGTISRQIDESVAVSPDLAQAAKEGLTPGQLKVKEITEQVQAQSKGVLQGGAGQPPVMTEALPPKPPEPSSRLPGI